MGKDRDGKFLGGKDIAEKRPRGELIGGEKTGVEKT